MSYSPSQYTGSGIAGPYTVGFPYLSQSHVEVRVAGVLKTVLTHYTWATASTIQFTAGNFPANPDVIDIRRRSSPDARLVDFQDAAGLTEASLDLADNQLFYLTQEAEYDATSKMGQGADLQWDAQTRKIENVTNGSAASDAVTMAQLAQVGLSPIGTVAIANGGTGQVTAAAARTALGVVMPALGKMTEGLGGSAMGEVNRPDFGQAQLTYTDTTHIKLIPFNGNKLVVNGVVCTVPDAGVSYTISGLAANTLYYVYDVATAGVITSLELSTTVPVASTTAGNNGTMIKTGDDTRSLAGMVRTNGSTLFANTALQRFVRSWFNDPGIALSGLVGSETALSSASYAAVNAATLLEFIAWAGEVGHAAHCANVYDSGAAGFIIYTAIGLNDSTGPGAGPACMLNVNNISYIHSMSSNRSDKLAGGYNYYRMLYALSGGSTPIIQTSSGITAFIGSR